jgi:hypothetical protein
MCACVQVRSCGPTVAATITAHHLEICVDDWAGKCHNFCKPVAKYPADRDALQAVVRQGLFARRWCVCASPLTRPRVHPMGCRTPTVLSWIGLGSAQSTCQSAQGRFGVPPHAFTWGPRRPRVPALVCIPPRFSPHLLRLHLRAWAAWISSR